MKKILFLSLIVLSSNLYGQIQKDSLKEVLKGVKITERTVYSENDTIPVVIKLKDIKKPNNVLWFLNGKLVTEQVASTINPNKIKELKVEKESNELNRANSEGKISIITKENYIPKLISLNELKAKYLNLSDKNPTLFMVNEKVINWDYDEYKVDERYILKIEVQSVENNKENLDINVIRLITRTKENVEKANTIKLRGT